MAPVVRARREKKNVAKTEEEWLVPFDFQETIQSRTAKNATARIKRSMVVSVTRTATSPV
jgi:hypothetical protein